jgi:polynucleotide 5'-kinase involved in rRNA processing
VKLLSVVVPQDSSSSCVDRPFKFQEPKDLVRAFDKESLSAMAGKKDARTRIQVVVIGDVGVGKSSMILAIATDSFAEGVPRVLPLTRLPTDFYPEGVPLTIYDSSSR